MALRARSRTPSLTRFAAAAASGRAASFIVTKRSPRSRGATRGGGSGRARRRARVGGDRSGRRREIPPEPADGPVELDDPAPDLGEERLLVGVLRWIDRVAHRDADR